MARTIYFTLESFADQSSKMLASFIDHITNQIKKDRSWFIIYFQNFSRFDGILLIRYLAQKKPDDGTERPRM